MSKRARRRFTPEQKSDAVKLVRQVGNLSQVARDLDLNVNVLRTWVRHSEVDAGKGPARDRAPATLAAGLHAGCLRSGVAAVDRGELAPAFGRARRPCAAPELVAEAERARSRPMPHDLPRSAGIPISSRFPRIEAAC